MSSSDSVAFDRAASFYDTTRQFSAESAARIVDLLTTELGGRGRCLEIGVGTGRIALPVAEAGIPLVGVDLSQPMLARLMEKSGGRPPLPVAVADATKLPFADGELGGAYAAHVLHLIPPWREAVGELVRVVRPGGVVLIDVGGVPVERGPLEDVDARFMQEAGMSRRHPGVEEEDLPELDRAFEGLGATTRLLPATIEERMIPIDGYLQLMRGNVFSWTWPLDDDTRNRAADAALAYAGERYGDVSTPRPQRHTAQWRAYDLGS